jgi:alkanesulfonate monooxygenase SsuD/methylene tetrahydromethanopterin reductase-like flavin-dependent oxidoreductase (luciferase family)
LGSLAGCAGRVRIGTAVTDVVRRHPVMVAQAATTLAELTTRPPILGVGAGEGLNLDPYGLGSPTPVSRQRRIEDDALPSGVALDTGAEIIGFDSRDLR